jgi:hypothetical protein
MIAKIPVRDKKMGIYSKGIKKPKLGKIIRSAPPIKFLWRIRSKLIHTQLTKASIKIT